MGIRSVFIREVRRMRKFRGTMFLLTLLPVVLVLFFVSVFVEDTPRDLPVAVVDYDQSSLSRRALRMVDATPSVALVADVQSVEEARDLMMKGKVSGVLVIPKDMERKVFRGEGIDVPLFIGGEKILNASLIYKDVFTTLSTLSSGVEIQFLMKGGLSEAEAYQKILPIYYEKHQLFNPYTSYSYFLLPGFLIILVSMFAIISSVFVIGVELKRGTSVEWVECGGGSILKSVVGKLLPFTIIYFVLQMFIFVVMFGYLGQPMNGNVWFMLFASLLYILGCQAFGVIIISLFL
ncbi:MAG: ABC transporter permease, partial [Rikenellaceae bacterium]